MYQVIQPTLPPKYAPSSPIPHPLGHVATVAWLLLPSSSAPLPTHLTPAARKALAKPVWSGSCHFSTQNPPWLPSFRVRAEGFGGLKTLHHPSLHFPCPLQPHVHYHPCSLHFLTALVSKARLTHPHLRGFVFAFSVSAIFILRCPYEPLPCLIPV